MEDIVFGLWVDRAEHGFVIYKLKRKTILRPIPFSVPLPLHFSSQCYRAGSYFLKTSLAMTSGLFFFNRQSEVICRIHSFKLFTIDLQSWTFILPEMYIHLHLLAHGSLASNAFLSDE